MKISFLKSFLKIIFVLAFVFCLSPFIVSASSTDNISGYAWSSNIGWISFNCTNDASCGTSSYGVTENLTTGYLTGYAWSSNIGWVKFGGLSGFPTGGGTTADNAKVAGSSLPGWAKALSGGDGSSGWDGWISLTGTSYGVTLSGTAFSGYAWGSEVVGWINFNGVVVAPAMSSTLTASNCIITVGNNSCTTTLSWSVINPEIVLGSSVTSSTNNSGATSANFPIVSSTSNPIKPPTTGTYDVGTKTGVVIPYIIESTHKSRAFFLYNNAKQLATALATASCDTGTIWDGIKCAPALINGICSSPLVYNTCSSGTPANGNGSSAWDCLGSNGGSNTSCTLSSGTTCFSNHYTCGDGTIIGTNPISSPSKWTWTCGSNSCSQKKSPGYIEN